MVQKPVGALCARVFGKQDLAAAALLEQPGRGHVVGVHMRIQGGHEPQAQLAQQGAIALLVFEDSVDDHGLARLAVAEQVGVGGGNGVEELAEDEHGNPRVCPWVCPWVCFAG